MDLSVAEFVESELVIDVRLNYGVCVEVEARHSDEHFEHRDVVLLYLNLRRFYILFQYNTDIIWCWSIIHTLNLTDGRVLQLYFLAVG